MDFQNLIPWFSSHGVKIVVILVIAYLVSRVGKIFIEKSLRKIIRKKDIEAEKKREDTLISTFNGVLKVTVWVIAIMMVLPEFGFNIAPILAGAGLVGLAVGMASRSLISDYLSGFFIFLEGRYQIGDSVEIAGVKGKVVDVNLRRTILKDAEGDEHFISNGQVKISTKKLDKKKIGKD